MKRRRNLIFVVVGLALVVTLGVLASGRRTTAVEAQLETARYANFTSRLPETGVVQRPQIDTLTAVVGGTVAGVAVKPGDRVAAGQTLVTLANPQLLSAQAGAQAAYDAAAGRLSSARQANTILPTQNQSSVEQARYNLEQARFTLNSALTDEKNGSQSGLGYGGATAASQRVTADANVANARTTLGEAQRIYDADRDLFANKAISADALSQQAARLAQAKVAFDQAKRERDDTYAQLSQNIPVLADRVRASRDAVRQAQAALAAAQLAASQNKAGDVQAAGGDAQARLNDLRYARDQVERLTIRAPYAGIVQTIATQTGDSLRPLQPGDGVTAGQAVITIAPDTGFIVRARVDEQDIAQIRLGEAATIGGEDLGGKSLRGRVVAIGAVAQKSDDPANTARQVITTIRLDGSLPFLRDGMNVDVDIVTVERPHVIAVASDAIRRDGGAPYVFTVRAGDGHAIKTPIAVGTANDSRTIVTRGLRPGDVVVADRNPAIAADVAVKAAAAPSPAPSPGDAG